MPGSVGQVGESQWKERSSQPGVGCDEALLLARSCRGDAEAFGQLVDRYAGPIVNLCCRMVGERADGEDLAQEAFVAAYKALPSFRADAKFSTWLYRIALNKCRDWLRARRPWISLEGADDEDTPTHEWATDERTPEGELTQRQAAEHLEQALQRVPHLYREAFILKHVEGLSYEEMEALLGVRGETLKMRVYKGRVQLARELAEWNDLAGC